MGGQACVLYGATEFSRDCDIVILCDPQNLDRLRSALQELDARPIAVPVLSVENLQRGHAVHFRCHAAKTLGIRLDVMAVLRGVVQFDELWSRRTTIGVDGANQFNLMGLPDLVSAKKTQRDKDWPMIRRLVEAHYQQRKEIATDDHVRFWLRESRTPAILIELAKKHPTLAPRNRELRSGRIARVMHPTQDGEKMSPSYGKRLPVNLLARLSMVAAFPLLKCQARMVHYD
jgi:hypothetical protein